MDIKWGVRGSPPYSISVLHSLATIHIPSPVMRCVSALPSSISVCLLRTSLLLLSQASHSFSINSLHCSDPEPWPTDARCVEFVGSWKYWHRERGHQTTTDDVLVAYMALFPQEKLPCLTQGPPVRTYVDLGCGIGSTLFLVAQTLRQARAVGIEAQAQSALLAARSARETGCSTITVVHEDIRAFLSGDEPLLPPLDSLPGNCDLATANPPYAPLTIGPYPRVR